MLAGNPAHPHTRILEQLLWETDTEWSEVIHEPTHPHTPMNAPTLTPASWNSSCGRQTLSGQ
ncbi:hypothetical protein DPMN_050152 [Dreissena polymorpha]|uniref:Uncharacterized protein n=1 Tax=Dreissena polymorpha TaxID=45954 RepID=A0A9D4CGN4_DREPO|nr:hypothetical protein DPMN_050152 [Dreissena polymorpha]